MPKVLSVGQMVAVEKAADASGLTYNEMMENAGRAVADTIAQQWPEVIGWRVVILAGSGNNGGDGLVAGFYLAEAGAQVSIYMTKERPEDDPNLDRIREIAKLIVIADHDQRWRVLKNLIGSADLIVDAVLGTGFKIPIQGTAKDVLGKTQAELKKMDRRPIVVAVDCPSGMDCDTGGLADESFEADLTVTLAAVKQGMLRFPGAEATGRIIVADIGIPKNQKEISQVKTSYATVEEIREWLPDRPKDAHKGTFGRVLIVAGSINFPGAAALTAIGAYRVGAGLVTLAVPASMQGFIVPLIPEATWIVLPHEIGVIAEQAVEVLGEGLEGSQALVVGPGFGLERTTEAFMNRLFAAEAGAGRVQIGFVKQEGKDSTIEIKLPPCVIDADGLKHLKELSDWPSRLPEGTILTPHPGEMAVLTELSKEEIQADRMGVALEWAAKWDHIVLLKGAHTVVASPDGRQMVMPFATSALARAGTGDVLAGIVAGLRAQGVKPYEAACLGAFIHGQAGVIAAQQIGTEASVLAGDVADAIPAALVELTDTIK